MSTASPSGPFAASCSPSTRHSQCRPDGEAQVWIACSTSGTRPSWRPCVRLLRRLGWRADVEVSYSRFGERGSIDILAVRPGAGIALVVEIKSELVAVEGTLRPMDAKTRLAPSIVFDRFGWRPLVVGRLLVLPDISTSRRRVQSHAHTLESALPRRGPAVARWLRQPDGQFAGLLFLPAIHLSDGRGNPSARKRVIGSPMRQAERGKRSATSAAEPVRGGNARQTSSEISRVNG